MIILLSINLVVEFFGYNSQTYESRTKLFWFYAIASPLITGCTSNYTTMSLRYFFLKIFTNRKGALSLQLKNSTTRRSFSNLERLTSRILNIMSSPWFGVIWSISFMVLEAIVLLIVMAILGWKPSPTLDTVILVIHTIFLLFMPVIYTLLQIYDMIMNFNVLIKCNLKKFYFTDDPFYYRIESATSLILIIVVIIWAAVLLPDYFKIALTEICLLWLIIAAGGTSLAITIYKWATSFCSKSSAARSKGKFDEIFEVEELYEHFFEYCKKEFSLENLLIMNDIRKFRKIASFDHRTGAATEIINKYLNGASSPFEVNVDAPTIKYVRENFEICSQDLFNRLEYQIKINLTDTFGRFIFTAEYMDYEKKIEFEKLAMGKVGQ